MVESSNFKESLKQNKGIFLAILMMPVFGMIIAIPLIIWRAPGSVMVAVPIILVLIAQYLLLVYWISKKMDQLTAS
jgi:glucan phosphoethanolaminetransferase (alkaline phosphatase superfamily)